MNKTEFVEYASKVTGVAKCRIKDGLTAVADALAKAMSDGESVTIRGIGKFSIRTMAERQGKNFKTGEPIIVPEHKTIKFTPSRSLIHAAKGIDE